jgi:hypothetical protein
MNDTRSTKYQILFRIPEVLGSNLDLRKSYIAFHGKFRQQTYLKLDHNFPTSLLTNRPIVRIYGRELW